MDDWDEWQEIVNKADDLQEMVNEPYNWNDEKLNGEDENEATADDEKFEVKLRNH